MPKQHAKEWKSLLELIGKLEQERNFLAHLTVLPDFSAGDEFELVLAPPTFVPPELVRLKKRYDAKPLAEVAAQFTSLSKKLGEFEQAMRT
jgi:hypothetical protein